MTAFTGTWHLARLIVRRDRLILPLWILVLGILPASYASAIAGLYDTASERQEYFASIQNNPAELGMLGPIYNSSLGSLASWRAGMLLAITGLASILTVIRHTRAEEEAGRRELVGAAAVGRQAGLAATMLVTAIANLLLGLICAAGLIGQDLPAAGAFALGLSMTATGVFFAAIGALAAQLTETASGARGIAIAFLGGAYLVRAAGDAGGKDAQGWLNALPWFSPLGWAQRIRPFAEERWPLLILLFAATALVFIHAQRITAQRDLGAGLLPPKLGPASASPGLRTPLALAWRLHRGTLTAWAIGFAIFGGVLGGAADSIAKQLDENENVSEIVEKLGGSGALSDTFLALLMGLLALAASGYAVAAASRLRAEETSGRLEPLLATATGRRAWLGSHLTFALIGPTIILSAAGISGGLAYGLAKNDVGHELPRVVTGAWVQLPAVWVLAGLTVALFGTLPRYLSVAWGALAGFVLLGQVGSTLKLSQWVLDVSPFTHIPKVPGGDFSTAPLIWLSTIAGVLILLGVGSFRRRDITS